MIVNFWLLKRRVHERCSDISSFTVFRAILLLALLFSIQGICYYGTVLLLDWSSTQYIAATSIKSIILSLIHFLTFIAILSSSISYIQSKLFHNEAWEFWESIPIGPLSRWFDLLIKTFLANIWMPLLLAIPVLIALFPPFQMFQEFISAGLFLSLLCLFSAAIALCFALINATLISKFFSRFVFLGFIVATLWWISSSLHTSLGQNESASLILNTLIEKLLLLQSPLLPTASFATAFEEPLVSINSLEILSLTIIPLLLSLFLFTLLRTQIINRAAAGMIDSKPWLSNFYLRLNRPLKALCFKELLPLVRDAHRSMQLLFLIAIVSIYLSVLPLLGIIDTISTLPKLWASLSVIFHYVIVIFVQLAFATRLIVPSISLENRQFFRLLETPVTIKTILLAKYSFWMIPLSLISVFLFIAGSLNLQLSFITQFLIFLTHQGVICALALLISSWKPNFDWESEAELVANANSIIFMLSALPISLLFIVVAVININFYQFLILVVLSLAAIFYLLKISTTILTKFCKFEKEL